MMEQSTKENQVTHIRFPHLVQRPTLEALAVADTTQPANTNDWDTVFAITYKDVNAQIKKANTSPTNFTAPLGTSLTSSGTFGSWQLSGGTGDELHMTIPIATGTGTYEGKSYSLDGASATAAITLSKLPQPAGPKGTPTQLKVNTEQAASVTQFTNPNGSGDPNIGVVNALIQGAITQWLNANLQDFNYIFSTVNVSQKAAKDSFQWLKTTDLGYACLKNETNEGDSLFGILAMTEGRTKPASAQISPNAIPTGARAGFLIAPERFLEKLVLPGIHTMFPGSTDKDFSLTNGGTQIVNVNTVKMDSVPISGSDYTPTLGPNTVQLTMESTYLDFNLKKAVVLFSPGIEIHMNYEAFTDLRLATQTGGAHTFEYYDIPDRKPIIDHYVETADWVTWTEVAASVLVAVATLGTGAAAKKVIEKATYRIVATIITLLVAELITNIAGIIKAVAEGNKDALPPVDLVIKNATDTVDWPGATEVILTSAGINGAFQLGVDPQFIH